MDFWLYGQYVKMVGLYVFDNYVPDSTWYTLLVVVVLYKVNDVIENKIHFEFETSENTMAGGV